MASSSAACVFGGVRLTSSASTTLANSGPSRKRNSRAPVLRFSTITSVPVMSAGVRSGVNWMRLKLRFSVRLSVLIIKVLASPGTPSSRQWPRLKRQMSSSSMTAVWPTMTWPNWSMILRRAASSFSMAVTSWGLISFIVQDSLGRVGSSCHR